MSNPTFHITVDFWGRTDSLALSQFSVRVGKDQRLILFRGDAYWQWGGTCMRNRDKNCCWTQVLHDSLEGWHACVLHTGDTVTILPRHPDYERVRQLVEDVDCGRKLPTIPTDPDCAWLTNES